MCLAVLFAQDEGIIAAKIQLCRYDVELQIGFGCVLHAWCYLRK